MRNTISFFTLLSTIALSVSSIKASVTVSSEDLMFTPLGGATTDQFSQADGEITFFNSANQGSGAVLDLGPNSPFSGSGPTFFNFSVRVGPTLIETFFGRVGATPNSADGRSADLTAFSLGISPAGVSTFSRGSESALLSPNAPSTSFAPGTRLTFDVVVNPTEQNPGQFLFDYDVTVTVDETGQSATRTGIRANQNGQSLATIEDYTFNGVGTRNGSGSVAENLIGPVIVSNKPILVPEPTATLFSAMALGFCALRRRR